MLVSHNINSLKTANKLIRNDNDTSKSMKKISSGLKILGANDDAGGMAKSASLKAQIRSLSRAQYNVQEGIHLARTISGTLDLMVDNSLNRLKELSLGAANDSSSSDDKQAAQNEVDQILKDIDSIANGTEYKGIKLLSSPSQTLSLQVGANNTDTLKIDLFDVRVNSIGLTGINVLSKNNALSAFDKVNTALATVSSYVVQAGSYEEQLEFQVRSLSDYEMKLTQSNSQIEDVDMARESIELAKGNLINEATKALFVQANHSVDNVVELLK